ncbi:Ig-like domain-containing protein [Candidatus Poribacteria bacterium]|nr:Ig-like domain-containing protein [Candidatus Poribacteria bacterium]
MQKLLKPLALVMAAMLAVFMIGCGGGEEEEAAVKAPNFVSSTPATGSEFAANGTLILTFDGTPAEVTVNGTPATVAGKTATWKPAANLPAGAVTLAVAWKGGAGTTLNFTVKAPDTDAPKLTKSTVANGAKDVEPDPLNKDGIVLEFNENVTGSAQLTLEDKTVLWDGVVKDNKVTFLSIKGKELAPETTYKITGEVKDGAGNATKIDITFVTKGKQ